MINVSWKYLWFTILLLGGCNNNTSILGLGGENSESDEESSTTEEEEESTDTPVWINGSYLTCSWYGVESDDSISVECAAMNASDEPLVVPEDANVTWETRTADNGTGVGSVVAVQENPPVLRLTGPADLIHSLSIAVSVNGVAVEEPLPTSLTATDNEEFLNCLGSADNLTACFDSAGVEIFDFTTPATLSVDPATIIYSTEDRTTDLVVNVDRPLRSSVETTWSFQQGDGSAVEGVHFEANTGKLTFDEQTTSATIQIKTQAQHQFLGDYVLYLNLVPKNDSTEIATQDLALTLKGDDSIPLQVQEVLLDGSTFDVNAPPISVPVGSGELQHFSFSPNDIDRIAIRFSKPITPTVSMLTLAGVNNATYSVTNVAFDASSNTASWTLTGNLPDDKYRLVLSDAELPELDGEWTNPTSYDATPTSTFPSGDGQPGGDFNFTFWILVGNTGGGDEADASNRTPLDSLRITNSLGDPTPYNRRYDINSNGVVDSNDAQMVINRLNDAAPDSLPAGSP